MDLKNKLFGSKISLQKAVRKTLLGINMFKSTKTKPIL